MRLGFTYKTASVLKYFTPRSTHLLVGLLRNAHTFTIHLPTDSTYIPNGVCVFFSGIASGLHTQVPHGDVDNAFTIIHRIGNNIKLTIPDQEYTPNRFGNPLKRCWKLKPEERPSFEELGILFNSFDVAETEVYVHLQYSPSRNDTATPF